MNARLESRHWLGKSLAGLILGFTLGLAVSGLFAWMGPDGINAPTGKTEFNMWLVAPVWAAVMSMVYLFGNSRRAWLWLGVANVIAFVLLWIVRAALR